MLKAMRHRMLATAAFAVLTLLSAEVGAAHSHRRAYSLMYGDWDVDRSVKVPAQRTMANPHFKDGQVEEIKYKTLDQYKRIQKQKAELNKVYTHKLPDGVTQEQVEHHITTQYYDGYYADDKGIQKRIENPDDLTDVNEPPANIEDYATFTGSFTLYAYGKEMKIQIPAVNGLGCYGKISQSEEDKIDSLKLKRDSAGNLFLAYDEKEKTFFGRTVEVTLYVHRLYFKTQITDEGILEDRISQLFPDGKHNGNICDLITKVRDYEAGYGKALKTNSPSVFCEDMRRNKFGVCRHRAYLVAYLLNEMGVTCIYAKNVNHAWVEIKGSTGKWACVELGGGSSITEDVRTKYEKYQKQKAEAEALRVAKIVRNLQRHMRASQAKEQFDTRQICQYDSVYYEDDKTVYRVECWWPDIFMAGLRHPDGRFINVDGEENLKKLVKVPEKPMSDLSPVEEKQIE